MTDPSPIPPPVFHVLRAAAAAELVATGPQRRSAFRVTRHLIAGCRQAGIMASDLAGVFAVRPEAIRNRGTYDGLVPAAAFADFAGIRMDELAGWQLSGLLPAVALDDDARPSYPASALISALLVVYLRESRDLPETA